MSVRIPRIDRTSTDLQRMPCIVVEAVGKAQAVYCLRCKGGALNACYQAADLEPFEGSFSL